MGELDAIEAIGEELAEEAVKAVDVKDRFYTFLREFKGLDGRLKYRERIRDMYVNGSRSLVVDWDDINVFDTALARLVIEDPTNTLRAASEALKEVVALEFPEYVEEVGEFFVRIRGLPETTPIRMLRAHLIGKLVQIEGVLVRATPIREQLTVAVFRCPSCGQEISVPQYTELLETPEQCPNPECRKTGPFKLLVEKSVYTDWQKIVVQERPEEMPPGQLPRSVEVVLRGDLVDVARPGDRITVVGVLRIAERKLARRGSLTTFDTFIDANYIEISQKALEEVEITREDERIILELAKDPNIREKIVRSIAPAIYGYEDIKKAIALLLFGGVPKTLEDGTRIRGDIHILIIGDPGTAKSQLLQYVARIAPRGIYTTGKGATAAGLCVLPDTYIILDNGVITTIGDVLDGIIDRREVNVAKPYSIRLAVFNNGNLSLEYKETKLAWKLNSNSILKISTRSGLEIGLTPDNPVLTVRNGRITWVRASELRPGDPIARARLLPKPSRRLKLDTLDLVDLPDDIKVKLRGDVAKVIVDKLKERYGTLREAAKNLSISEDLLYSFTKHAHFYGMLKRILDVIGFKLKSEHIEYVEYRNGLKHKIPSLTPDLGYLIGYILGDGTVYIYRGGVRGYIRVSTKDPDIAAYLLRLLEKLFGRKPKLHVDNRTGVYSITFHSIVLAKMMYNAGYRKPKDRIVLNPLLTALDDDFIYSLIAGLIDSGGSFVIRKSGENCRAHIEFVSTSKDLVYKLHLLLLRYGIFSKIRERKPSKTMLKGRVIKGRRTKYLLLITDRDSILRYARFISTRCPRKRAILEKMLFVASGGSKDLIPADLVRDILLRYFRKKDVQSVIKSRSVSKEWLMKFIDKIIDVSDREYLRSIINAPILWDRVKTITMEGGSHVVYDLTVTNHHNFIANGLIIHNTAAVVRDKRTGEYYLEAGALVLADGGICAIDEIDKMRPEDRVAIHEAMEQQTISIAKAGIVARLNARCAILAAGNPVFGRYIPERPIVENINLPVTILSRFDLIFILRDVPSDTWDVGMAEHILRVHREAERVKPEIPPDLLKKYICYARRFVKPRLTEEAIEKLKEFFVEMRRRSAESPDAPVAITARQLEALVRLAEAHARMALKNEVTVEDALEAIRLMKKFLESVGLDVETGRIDIDVVMTGKSRSQQERLSQLMALLSEMQAENEGKPVRLKDLIKRAEEIGLSRSWVEKALRILKNEGTIYEPRPGFVAKVS